MPFTPIGKMMERVETNGDSDALLFYELLYAGEFAIKLSVLASVASIEDNRENYRYRFLHKLVRADGIGDWTTAFEDICTGPASQHILPPLVESFRVFTQRVGEDSWQYKSIYDLQEVLSGIYSDAQNMSKKVSLRAWFTKFVELRNKTRGHGAVTPATCAKLVLNLRTSIQLLIENSPMFQLPWAYLHRNLSGKYKVVELGGDTSCFSELKTAAATHGENYPDGVYLWLEKPRLVPLLHSDIDATDFFVPNGKFNGQNYELHSPITDNRRRGEAQPYLTPPSDRPPSETEGLSGFDIIGEVFANLPDTPAGYVKRPSLEQEIREKLTNDRHPVVTLVGRGGIGKTSLALTVLHEIAHTDRYGMILWFSARDIDLTPTGPKVVQPKTLTEKEIHEEYRELITGLMADSSIDTIVQAMRGSKDSPKLFVFDNFETVRSPIDLYHWIDTNIRLPNKAVITTRFRDFKADFPIEVSGMEHAEAKELIRKSAGNLEILDKISPEETEQIIEESDGHPYVIKIILGEIADKGTFAKPSQMLARKDDILNALFERTYDNLSPLAKRIFLTLSGWRSLVPQIALEAVLRWRSSERVDPETAVDELVRMSLIERTEVEEGPDFLGIPTITALFGRKKLEVSHDYELIRDDIEFLGGMGPTMSTDLRRGNYPRIESFFKRVALQISRGSYSIEEMRPMLEFMAQNYPPAWLMCADLERETGDGLEREINCVERFLEQNPVGDEAQKAWLRLVRLYLNIGNIIGSCNAFLNAAKIKEPDLDDVSNMANYANGKREIIERMDAVQRSALFKPLAQLMESHRQSASATDLSRLAWLYLHSGEDENALRTAEEGLQAEPDNVHCRRLITRLRG